MEAGEEVSCYVDGWGGVSCCYMEGWGGVELVT